MGSLSLLTRSKIMPCYLTAVTYFRLLNNCFPFPSSFSVNPSLHYDRLYPDSLSLKLQADVCRHQTILLYGWLKGNMCNLLPNEPFVIALGPFHLSCYCSNWASCMHWVQGNLGWAYMQQANYAAAEIVYRKAQQIDPEANKACNLCMCLIKQTQYAEARSVLEDILQGKISGSDDPKSRNRVEELMKELEPWESAVSSSSNPANLSLLEDSFLDGLDQLMNQWTPFRSKRLPIFEEISPYRDQLACWSLSLSLSFPPYTNIWDCSCKLLASPLMLVCEKIAWQRHWLGK